MNGEAQTLFQLAKYHWKYAKEVKTVLEFQEKIADESLNAASRGEVPRLALLALTKVTELRLGSLFYAYTESAIYCNYIIFLSKLG